MLSISFRWMFVLACLIHVQAQAQETYEYQLTPRKIAQDTYVFEGRNEDFSRQNGCNIINTGFIVMDDGVLVINTGPSKKYGIAQRAAIQKVTDLPIKYVLNLNLHPDYFLGNQAYPDRPIGSLPASIKGMKLEGSAYTDNLYHICGDWMTGTESTPADREIKIGELDLSSPLHQIELMELSGHTDSDLVLIDKSTGVVFVGGIVFSNRVPTTPHSNVPKWLSSLKTVSKLNTQGRITVLVPSHGPIDSAKNGIEKTSNYLIWLDESLKNAALQGMDVNEVLRQEVPSEFKEMAAFKTEYLRNVMHLYPEYEKQVFNNH